MSIRVCVCVQDRDRKREKRRDREEGKTNGKDNWEVRRALPQLLTPVYLMMHQFHPAIPHRCCLTPSLHSLLSNTQTQPVVIHFFRPFPLPIVYFMDPLWSIKGCCFCQPLTVLCVCHSGLVKRWKKKKIHIHTSMHTNTPSFPQLRIPSGKIIPFRWELFCHYPV